MAKGVYKISGNTTPKVLEKNTYKVETWYPETPYSERDSAKVTWELFVEENGKFRTTHIKKKGIGDFTFGKNAYKHTYKIEGYLYAPEGKEPMSLVIRPQKNDGASLSNEKEILGVRLTYEDGSKITKPLSYMDRLMATAKCQNLEGRYIIFELWEDDEKGSGHNKKNQSIIKSQPIRVDSRGYASWNFTLLNTFISLAQQREGEDKKHEYYVTAEYNGKILNNSGNINVNNPTPVIKITPKSSSKSKTTASTNNPQPKPQPNSAKGSTHQGSKNNQSDDKGIITSIKITDLKGQFFKKRPKFGERIQIVIEGKSIKGKDYTLRLWEDDTTGKNDLLYERRGKFESNSQMFYVDLTEEMQRVGEIGNNSQNPDYGEYWTGNYQEIFAEVIVNTRTAQSQIINVDLKAEARKPEKTRTPTKVGETKRKEGNGKCPRCKTLTLLELNEVFPSASLSEKSEIMNAFNLANTKFGLDSCQQKAHFFAQVLQEVGESIDVKNGENLNYSAEALPMHFSKFRVDPNKKYNKITNGPNSLAFKYGRSIQNNYTANQEMIANIAYANKEGNGGMNSGDGWKYRGRGIIQITFKNKYIKINDRIKSDYPEYKIAIDANNINNLDEGTVASMAYWKEYGCQAIAEKGYVRKYLDLIVDIINPATDSRNSRWENLKKCVKIFKVEECTGEKNETSKDSNESILEEMKELVDRHIPYSQSGERASLSEKGLKNLDCSETVGIYLHKLGVMPTLVAIHTGIMTNQTSFRKAIGSDAIDFVRGSENSDFVPQRGDIFVWRKSNGVGHTGIVYSYDENKDLVTILEAIGSVGSADETTNKNNGGHAGKGMSRTAIYKRSGKALFAHSGWVGYFRPKNYTKKL